MADKEQLLGRMKSALPATAISDRLVALPGGGTDPRPFVEAVRRDLTGVETALKRDIGSVDTRLKQNIDGLAAEAQRRDVDRSLERAMRRLEHAMPDLDMLAAARDEKRSRAASQAAAEMRAPSTPR